MLSNFWTPKSDSSCCKNFVIRCALTNKQSTVPERILARSILDFHGMSLKNQPTTTDFPRNDDWETSTEIPYWWRVTTRLWVDFWVVLLIDWLKQISLAERPIRAATQIWVVTRHQYGISVVVPRASFAQGNQWWRRKMSAVFLRLPWDWLISQTGSTRN